MKLIYGTLLGVVLFFNKLKGILVDIGFKLKEYDECIFNKMINGDQFTIQIHVDSLKLLHVQQDELNKIIDQLNDVFGSKGELLKASYGTKLQVFGNDH